MGRTKNKGHYLSALGRHCLPPFYLLISQRRGGWGRFQFSLEWIVKTFPSRLKACSPLSCSARCQTSLYLKDIWHQHERCHISLSTPLLKEFWKMLHPTSGACRECLWGQAVLQGRLPRGQRPHLERVLGWFLQSKWRRKTIDEGRWERQSRQWEKLVLWSLQTWTQILKMLSSVPLIQRNSFWLRCEEKSVP